MDIEFEPDNGTIRTYKAEKLPSVACEDVFEADSPVTRSRVDYTGIIQLLHGWSLAGIPKHSVDNGHLPELPSARCISDTFGISVSSAHKILDKLRKELVIHKVDLKLRYERGDALTRYVRQLKERREALHEFQRFSRAFLKGRDLHEALGGN